MKTDNGVPVLDCPDCGRGLIPAQTRGRTDDDGNYIEHNILCRCRWCDWTWWDDGERFECSCGSVARVHIDDDHAYAREVPR